MSYPQLRLLTPLSSKSAGKSADKTESGDVAIDNEDVKLVVAQTGCDEEAAKKALVEAKGDLINASELP